MHNDCHVTLLTPAGRGAIATISVVGQQAVDFVERFFQPLGRRSLRTSPARDILVGHWRSGAGQQEEVVVTRWDETRVDIHCHGGMAASQALLDNLTASGAIFISSESWLRQQVRDPIQRAAHQAISLARTERTAGILLDQWRGAFATAIHEIIDNLQTVQFAEKASRRLERLMALSDLGLHLTSSWRVVLSGPPNVGKSSLTNAILGYDRCIVFDQPGTTRDVVSATTALDGWAIELSDTAGYRESGDAVEQEGTRRAWRQVQDADLVVIIVDAIQPDRQYVEGCRQAARSSLVVANKIDKCLSSAAFPSDWLLTSAVTRVGIEELAREMVGKLVPTPPEAGEAVPFTAQQVEHLKQAQFEIASGNAGAASSLLQELLTCVPQRHDDRSEDTQ